MTEPTQESREMADKIAEALAEKGFTYVSPTIIARTLDKLHGREPVDPLLVEARELVINDGTDRTENQKAVIRAGDGTYGKVALALAGLKRGMTLAPRAEPKPWTDDDIRSLWLKSRDLSDFRVAFRSHLKERGE